MAHKLFGPRLAEGVGPEARFLHMGLTSSDAHAQEHRRRHETVRDHLREAPPSTPNWLTRRNAPPPVAWMTPRYERPRSSTIAVPPCAGTAHTGLPEEAEDPLAGGAVVPGEPGSPGPGAGSSSGGGEVVGDEVVGGAAGCVVGVVGG